MEEIAWDEIVPQTYRLKVYGGWLVNYLEYYEGVASSSMCFVPDSEHKWQI